MITIVTNFLNKEAKTILLVWIFILFVLYSTLSVLRHIHFQSGGFDLGLYDQAVWQYSQFISPYNTIKDRFILGDHLTLTLPLLSPLFYFWNDVRILLIFQAFWLSFSTIAIYKLALIRKFSPLVSFNLSFIYSLFYGIQFLIFFDFHAVSIGVGLIAWLIYFLEAKKKKLFFITLILALLTQENMGIALAGLGLIYVFKKQYRKTAISFIIFGILFSFLAAKIISLFSPIGFQYMPKTELDPVKILVSFFDQEEKRLTWLYSLGWFSFLPVFCLGSVLAVFLDLSQYFASGPDFSRMWSPFMHHRAILAPFLLLGILEVLEFLKKRKIDPLLVSTILVISVLSQQYFFHFPLNKLTKPIYWKTERWMNDNYSLFKLIPKDASLAVQQNLIPHLSHRQKIYLIWPRKHDFKDKICGEVSCWWLDFGGKPQYLVVDLHPNQWLTQLLETNENFESAVRNMEKMEKIKLVKQVNYAKMYKISY